MAKNIKNMPDAYREEQGFKDDTHGESAPI
jgi:hypothetical protein